MAVQSKENKLGQDNGLNPFSGKCLEFANLVIDEPLVYSGYGKMSSKNGSILENELKEEKIEVVLDRIHN